MPGRATHRPRKDEAALVVEHPVNAQRHLLVADMKRRPVANVAMPNGTRVRCLPALPAWGLGPVDLRDDRRQHRWTGRNLDDLDVGAEALADCVALYAGGALTCRVGGALVVPQPGGFYGGWITPELAGPFKGEPGSEGW